MSRRLGPDATRYWIAGSGTPVSRPFHARWLLPTICCQSIRRWWIAWFIGYAAIAVGAFWWRLAAGDGWQRALATAGLLTALPGILGPSVTVPVGVDVPATGVALCGVAFIESGNTPGGVALICVAAMIRETAPIWSALWVWSLWPLIAIVPVIIAYSLIRSGPDPLGERFQRIADHPVRTALEAHRNRWRDGWMMVAPWGACLAALWLPTWQMVILLALAYAQLLVATDTVRLYQHAAAPLLAASAASVLPVRLLLPIIVVHAVWWRTPERV